MIEFYIYDETSKVYKDVVVDDNHSYMIDDAVFASIFAVLNLHKEDNMFGRYMLVRYENPNVRPLILVSQIQPGERLYLGRVVP